MSCIRIPNEYKHWNDDDINCKINIKHYIIQLVITLLFFEHITRHQVPTLYHIIII